MFTDITFTGDDKAEARIGDAGLIAVKRHGLDHERRMIYRWWVKEDGKTLERGHDLRTGVGMDHEGADGPGIMLGTLATFLGAAAESYRAYMQPVVIDPLFNAKVQEWAYQNEDDLSMVVCATDEEN